MRNRYIDRDKDGKICATFVRPQRPNHEKLPEDHSDVVAFEAGVQAAIEAPQQDDRQRLLTKTD